MIRLFIIAVFLIVFGVCFKIVFTHLIQPALVARQARTHEQHLQELEAENAALDLRLQKLKEKEKA